MLEGVTGVICCVRPMAPVVDEFAMGIFRWLEDALSSNWEAGSPGGGIDKSTGDGVSPGISVLVLFLRTLPRDERRSGVEDADFVLR